MTQRTWRSPSSVHLIGEPAHYNQGFSLSLASGRGANATVFRTDDPYLELVSAQRELPVEIALADLVPGCLTGWASYPASVVWALNQRGHALPGLSISVDVDLDTAGLGSAVQCAVAGAVADLCGIDLTQRELLAVIRQADIEFVGGDGAQLASVFGELGKVLLCDLRSLDVEAISFDVEGSGLQLLIVDCGVAVDPAPRRAECAQAARELGVASMREISLDDLDHAASTVSSASLGRRIRHLVSENDRTLACAQLLRAGHIPEIGPLLNASHESLRDDYEVSAPEIDLAVQIMLAFDAVGARCADNGFALGLLTPRQARAGALAIRSAFSGRGYREPVSFMTTPATGVHAL